MFNSLIKNFIERSEDALMLEDKLNLEMPLGIT